MQLKLVEALCLEIRGGDSNLECRSQAQKLAPAASFGTSSFLPTVIKATIEFHL